MQLPHTTEGYTCNLQCGSKETRGLGFVVTVVNSSIVDEGALENTRLRTYTFENNGCETEFGKSR
jgi:hypothetical protein